MNKLNKNKTMFSCRKFFKLTLTERRVFFEGRPEDFTGGICETPEDEKQNPEDETERKPENENPAGHAEQNLQELEMVVDLNPELPLFLDQSNQDLIKALDTARADMDEALLKAPGDPSLVPQYFHAMTDFYEKPVVQKLFSLYADGNDTDRKYIEQWIKVDSPIDPRDVATIFYAKRDDGMSFIQDIINTKIAKLAIERKGELEQMDRVKKFLKNNDAALKKAFRELVRDALAADGIDDAFGKKHPFYKNKAVRELFSLMKEYSKESYSDPKPYYADVHQTIIDAFDAYAEDAGVRSDSDLAGALFYQDPETVGAATFYPENVEPGMEPFILPRPRDN